MDVLDDLGKRKLLYWLLEGHLAVKGIAGGVGSVEAFLTLRALLEDRGSTVSKELPLTSMGGV